VGRAAARADAERWAREESPGSMDMRCRITSGGRKPRESATENRPPPSPQGESGKGETVRQERTASAATSAARQTPLGATRKRGGAAPSARAGGRDGCPDPPVGVGCGRRRATGVEEEWPSRAGASPRPTDPGLQAG